MRRTNLLRMVCQIGGLLLVVACAAMPSHAQCGVTTGTSNTPYLVFGPQSIGTTSPAQTATVTFSTTCATVVTVTISGNNINSNAPDFVLPDNAGSCPGAIFEITNGKPSTCTLLETFAPMALGTRTGSAALTWTTPNSTNGTTTVNLIGGDEIVYVTTGVGGQVLTVDTTTPNVFEVLSNAPQLCGGPCAFNPTGAVVGPDAKIYITDSVNNNIWRMNQDGSLPEAVFKASGCPAAGPCNPEGPSFSATGNGDLYFNTFKGLDQDGLFFIQGAAALTNTFPGTFNLPVNVEPGTCDSCGSNGFPAAGTGTAFDANGNLLAADQENSEIWSLAPPYEADVFAPAAILSDGTSTVGVSSSVVGIALNKANGQTYFAQSGAVVQIIPPANTGPYTTTPYSAFTTTNSGCEVSDEPLPDVPEYIAFDMTGNMFGTTSTSPLNINVSPAENGCGRVWRINPGASPTPALLVDLNAVDTNGIVGVCVAPCGLTSTQAIGVAIPPTQSAPQFFSLPANGGSVAAGYPSTCHPTLIPPNDCASTIGFTWPGGIFVSPDDELEVIFVEKTQAEFTAEIAGTNYGNMGIMGAPVTGHEGRIIVPSTQCVNMSNGSPCSDMLTTEPSYEAFATWASDQAHYCTDPSGTGMMDSIYFWQGEPAADVAYTSLNNILGSCFDGQPGTKGIASCTTKSSSGCLSRWPNGFGPALPLLTPATASITSPANGAKILLNGAASAMFTCTSSSSSTVEFCPGLVTKPDGTIVSVTSGAALPTSLLGTYTLSVTPNVNAPPPPVSALATYQVNGYGFLGFQSPYAPPPATFKVTRTLPLIWQYTDSLGNVVASAAANPVVLINGPYSCGGSSSSAPPIVVNDPGSSGYQYFPSTNTWQFNWQIKGNQPGCYNITVETQQTGQITAPFAIDLVQ